MEDVRRASRDDTDLPAMQRLASRLWPLGFHPGGLGWSVATGQFGAEVVLFGDADEVLGFAGVDQPGTLLAQADPAHPGVSREIVARFLEHADGRELNVDVVDADAPFRRALEEAGFIRRDDMRPVHHMRRAAGGHGSRQVAGYAVRGVDPTELAARVAVHRAAWEPPSLPWHPDHRPPTAADATSSFTEHLYERVRRTWLYDAAFDLVAVAADGTFAACCIVWFDPASGTAEIEPLGVDPAHRRRGLAGALCDEAAARVAAAWGRQVVVNIGPSITYPAPAGAYAKARFETVERGSTYTLRFLPGP